MSRAFPYANFGVFITVNYEDFPLNANENTIFKIITSE